MEKNSIIQLDNIAKALVVEDNLLAQKIARQLLISSGFDVDATDNGKDAINMVKHYQYALILLDFGLPDICGDNVSRTIRAFENEYIKTPCHIVLLSASTDKKQEKQSLTAGVNQVFRKPLTSKIIDKIKKSISS